MALFVSDGQISVGVQTEICKDPSPFSTQELDKKITLVLGGAINGKH